MTGLSPGTVPSSKMDSRQWARWCEAQSIEGVASAAIAAHVAESDPHTQYVLDTDLTAAIAAGTYTPVLTNVANISVSTAYQAQYMRVRSVVTVSGKVDLTTLAAVPTNTQLGISLPVASNFGAQEDCAGTGTVGGTAGFENAFIRADTTNDRAELFFAATTIAAKTFYFVFQYRVI